MNTQAQSARQRTVGRFAPTPSGPLHLGSLVAALGSFLAARAAGGLWRLRVDDLDPLRSRPGANADILATLEAHGLHWDGPVLYQSSRREAYLGALATLRRRGAAYACSCTRRDVARSARRGIEGPIYPGTCRNGAASGPPPSTWRIRVPAAPIVFRDAYLGPYAQSLQTALGDFVIWRRDGVAAYHLACVVDDAEQGVTQVVRGSDLLASTARQIHLQRCLRLTTPQYAHIPVLRGPDGRKLAKSNGAPALDRARAPDNLRAAFGALMSSPPAGLQTVQDLLAWGLGTFRALQYRDPSVTPAGRESETLLPGTPHTPAITPGNAPLSA